jgi:hypothetical protein
MVGLSPDRSRLAQEAWAQAEIDSGAPGAPLARHLAAIANRPAKQKFGAHPFGEPGGGLQARQASG